MEKSTAYSIAAALLMGLPAIWVIIAPLTAQELCVRIVFALLFVLGIVALIVQGILLKRERNQAEAEQIRRDKILEEIAKSLAHSSATSQPAPQPTLARSLQERVAQVAEELFAYLREKGPVPEQPPLRATIPVASWEERWKHFWEVKRPLEQRIDAGYSHRFADTVSKFRHEIQESGINTSELDRLVDQKYHDSETIRKLATMLLELSVRIQVDELSGPTSAPH